jgi:AcrR family transcriptional regulator
MALSTRERILSTARVAPNLTMAELARKAGVSRATVHRHFPSREDLLRTLEVEPEPASRDRALQAAIALLAQVGLARLSMDAVAANAGISRANLYRLFPGKPALFRELVRTYSPLEPIGATVRELADQPPSVVMPALARAAARQLEGRLGLVRSLLFEVSAPSPEAATARELAIETAVAPVTAYVLKQMEAGRLRRMPPLLAVQAFVGPLIAHMMLRPFAEELLCFALPIDTAVAQLADVWLAGMAPA